MGWAQYVHQPIHATCVDAPGDAREIFGFGVARRRVLTCVRPHLRPFTCRGPGWSSRIRSNSRSRAQGTLLHAGFPDPVSSTVAPSLSFDFPTPPTAPRTRALTRSRPELGRPRLWPSRPRPCGPSYWPMLPAPASVACGPACETATIRLVRHDGPPSAGQHSPR